VDPAVDLDFFALLDHVPSRDEMFVFLIGGCRVTGQKVTVIEDQNAFVRCVAAASVSYVNRVSKYNR